MTTDQTIETVAAQLGLTMEATYDPPHIPEPCKRDDLWLCWKVKLMKGGRLVLETPYKAGCGHCPSYVQGPWSVDVQRAIVMECRTGQDQQRRPILPKFANVLANLVMDGNAINYPTFEEYARDMDCNPDSRKEEDSYRKCVEIGLKLRAALGEDGLLQLTEACQNY